MAVKKHSHRKWINYWGSRQSGWPVARCIPICVIDWARVDRFLLPRALLHESVEVDRTLLPDAQAVISTL